MIMNNYKSLLLFIVLITVLYLAYNQYKKEKFSLFEPSKSINQISGKYFIGNKDFSLSNGMVFKHLCDAGYQYIYKFNLPNPVGSVYTSEAEPLPYNILAGPSKDNLEVIGALKRSSDGWFYFSVETDKDYKYTQIATNPGNKVLFEQSL